MTEKPDWSSSSGKLFLLLVLGPLFIAGLCQLTKAGQYLFFRGDTTFPESAVVQTALWAKDSGHLYPALDESPYTPAPYGPLFYLSLTGFAKLGAGNLDRLLVLARLLALSAFLLVVFAAYRWGRRQMLAPAAALAGAAFILSQIDFEAWNATARPDLIALLASFIAFFVLTTAPITMRRAVLAGCLCGIAGLLKQSYIALPIAAFLWLFFARQRRAALVFFGATAAVGAAGLLPLAFRHEPFAREMLLARYSPMSVGEAVRLLKADFLNYPGQIALLGLGALGLWRMNPEKVPARPMIITYFVLAWLTNFYTAMAPGASMNAFLEAWVVTSVCAGFAVLDLMENWEKTAATARGVIVLLWLTVMAVDLNLWRITVSVRPPSEYGKLAQAVTGRRVLSDIPYVSAHGARPELLDPSVNHYLEMAGHWSAQPVLRDLKAGNFDYVMVGLNGRHPRQWRGLTLFSTSILAQIDSAYRPICASDRLAVFVPRSRAVDGTEELKRT